jgi:hypothetical protein
MPIHIEDYTFDGPFARVEDLKERAGVYAVVCLMSNQKHFLIDVGESDNIRNAIETHERKECWITNCKGSLLVAALYTTELDNRGRADIVAFIRSREFVPCGNKQ